MGPGVAARARAEHEAMGQAGAVEAMGQAGAVEAMGAAAAAPVQVGREARVEGPGLEVRAPAEARVSRRDRSRKRIPSHNRDNVPTERRILLMSLAVFFD
jgi:hypothetical protein